jgi:hypothetical protein
MKLRLRSAWVVALAVVVSLGCAKPSAPVELASGKPLPESSAQAIGLKASGTAWTNAEVRAHYLVLVAAIGPANAHWMLDGISAEERAHRAFQMRHDARLTCRAMMSDARELAALEQRDQAKYGHPDGPRFEELVAHERALGLAGDAVFEAIVASAQRTNNAVNEMYGL